MSSGERVAQKKAAIMVRPDPELHALVLAAGRTVGSMNRWAIAAFREKLARQLKGQEKPPPREVHHEDPRDEFEWAWTHALIRHLRQPGKTRYALDLLADIWQLPELPKGRR
jgi:hypothetical protein